MHQIILTAADFLAKLGRYRGEYYRTALNDESPDGTAMINSLKLALQPIDGELSRATTAELILRLFQWLQENNHPTIVMNYPSNTPVENKIVQAVMAATERYEEIVLDNTALPDGQHRHGES